jgi:Holliday junction resolvasome RuvABC ATP-dependent DNA helicase subunit
MKAQFDENDVGLMKIRFGISAVRKTNALLEKVWDKFKGAKSIPSTRPTVVPHTMFAGPGGCGKTRRVEVAAEMMGCTEENGTFVKLTPDAIKSPENLIDVLMKKLSWKGYMDAQGKVDHKPGEWPKIVDPKNPVAPTENIAVFIDEIHDLHPNILNAMLIILYEFEYQYTDKEGNFHHIHFPKFTCFGATTDLGDLPAPLRTRFVNQIEIEYYTNKEMFGIIKSMVDQRDLTIDDDAATILALCSQGVARLGENHVRGLYEASCFFNEENYSHLSIDLAKKYIKIAQYVPDGLKYRQIKVLEFLFQRGRKNGQWNKVGEVAICDHLGVDRTLYKESLEPILMMRGLIERGARGRALTDKGEAYLASIKAAFPEALE